MALSRARARSKLRVRASLKSTFLRSLLLPAPKMQMNWALAADFLFCVTNESIISQTNSEKYDEKMSQEVPKWNNVDTSWVPSP